MGRCLHLRTARLLLAIPDGLVVVGVVVGGLPLVRTLHGSLRGDRLTLDASMYPGWSSRGRPWRRREERRMSHRLRKSLGGRVLLGGESCSGVSFHGIVRTSNSGRLAAGVTAGFLVCGGSLASVTAQDLKQFLFRSQDTKNRCPRVFAAASYTLFGKLFLPRKDTARAICC